MWFFDRRPSSRRPQAGAEGASPEHPAPAEEAPQVAAESGSIRWAAAAFLLSSALILCVLAYLSPSADGQETPVVGDGVIDTGEVRIEPGSIDTGSVHISDGCIEIEAGPTVGNCGSGEDQETTTGAGGDVQSILEECEVLLEQGEPTTLASAGSLQSASASAPIGVEAGASSGMSAEECEELLQGIEDSAAQPDGASTPPDASASPQAPDDDPAPDEEGSPEASPSEDQYGAGDPPESEPEEQPSDGETTREQTASDGGVTEEPANDEPADDEATDGPATQYEAVPEEEPDTQTQQTPEPTTKDTTSGGQGDGSPGALEAAPLVEPPPEEPEDDGGLFSVFFDVDNGSNSESSSSSDNSSDNSAENSSGTQPEEVGRHLPRKDVAGAGQTVILPETGGPSPLPLFSGILLAAAGMTLLLVGGRAHPTGGGDAR